jgi:hypothetical protein
VEVGVATCQGEGDTVERSTSQVTGGGAARPCRPTAWLHSTRSEVEAVKRLSSKTILHWSTALAGQQLRLAADPPGERRPAGLDAGESHLGGRLRVHFSREPPPPVNGAKWGAVIALAVLTLFAIAFVHSGNRRGAAIAMALFASAAVAAIVMIAAQERPFAGHFAVSPTPLEQVEPTLPH